MASAPCSFRDDTCSRHHIPHLLVFGVDELRDDAACLPELHHIAVQLEDELVDVAGEGGVAWVWRGESVKCGCCWGRGKSLEKGESVAAEENMVVMVYIVGQCSLGSETGGRQA